MVQEVERGDKLHTILSLVLRTVPTLHARAAAQGTCDYTFFATKTGKRSNVGLRLNSLLRDELKLGDAVTGTGIRRATVSEFAADPTVTTHAKHGAPLSQCSGAGD